MTAHETGAPRAARSRSLRLVFALLALTGTGVSCLIVAEVGLRLTQGEVFYPYHPGSVRVYYPTPERTPGVSGPSFFSVNSLGTRGPEPDDAPIRLLTVGGSTTACSALDDSEAWPAVLMTLLNEGAPPEGRVWVTNSGVDGHNTSHHIMHARYLLPRIPRLDYVLYYAGMNDSGRWIRNDEPLDLDDPDVLAGVMGQAFGVSHFTPPDWPVYKRLRLYKLAARAKALLASRAVERMRAAGNIVQDAHMEWLEEERQRRRLAPHQFLPPEKLAQLPRGLDDYERNLRELIALTRAAGAEPVLVSQAMLGASGTDEERALGWMGALDRAGNAYLKAEQHREILRAFNQRMAAVAADAGVRFFDMAAHLEDKPGIYYDAAHLNEAGCRQAAAGLAAFLRGTLRPDPLGVRRAR